MPDDDRPARARVKGGGVEHATSIQPSLSRLVRYWSKEINGTLPGGRKKFVFRGDGPTMVHASRAGLILSIPVEEVSLGSPRVGTIHVQAPTPHAPALQAFLVDFSQQTTEFSHL